MISAAENQGLETDFEEIATNGVDATVGDHRVRVGKASFVQQLDSSLEVAHVDAGEVVAYVAIDGEAAGIIYLADSIRPESGPLVKWLGDQGVERVTMLTGDGSETADTVAEQLGITEVPRVCCPRTR